MKKTQKKHITHYAKSFLILSLSLYALVFINEKHRELAILEASDIETVQSTVYQEKTPTEAISKPTEDFTDKVYIAKLVNEYADFYGVDRRTMHLIVSNESGYNHKAYVQHDGGHNWQAYGLAQINMKFWGSKITPEQAKNPHFALDFLARKIKAGDGELWTTYRTCINKEVIIYKGKKIKCDYNKVITV